MQYLMTLVLDSHSLSSVTINISLLWVKNNLEQLFGNSVHQRSTDMFFSRPIPILIISNQGDL